MNTTWGEMMSTISNDSNEQTPLQSRLNTLTSSIGKVGLLVAFLVLVVLLIRYFTRNTQDENGNTEYNGSKTKADDIINSVVAIIAAAMTIVVVAIPEGLPLAVTLTLAYSMKRMMSDNAMVRKLSACETMGSATTICTDKTRTFTLNQMKVIKFWLGQDFANENDSSSIATSVVELLHQALRKRRFFLEENCLTLLGLVGLKDPCRLGVKKAVEECQYAGVNVKMITGDNIFTGRAIATECEILKPNQDMKSGAVVEGAEFRNYTPEEQMEKVDKIYVMARSSPFDKLLMVQCLRQKGHVVAVTGDGTNDASALKEADIGLSMGIQGIEVAKESSDIVILDDNFGSVATVLRWGRCVYTNIQKFIQFQLTVNVAALVINFVAAVSAGEVPLSAVQLLWVNLIMDTLGALALATEKPTKELMEKPPVGEAIFNVGSKVNDTMIFNVFVLCQVFNEFNARKLEKKNVFEGIHKSKLFLVIVGVTIVLQVVMVEFLKKFADIERLNWWQWGVCVGFASVSWPIGWTVKWIPVPEKPFLSQMGEFKSCVNKIR
ncbi:hypothetical protein RHSIM_Rhsim02G0030100 [Rhododendron simsii]|uniref:Cation-transporting P-type ATPase C-terminal domain-containing protein n=1 Tax=Rhododendron simsii TaxID=118357 RepID=A0A834HD08_RHOSS|nr:hypothetical protein RHSIM_Rhsim02G0030100 [Rhododendron simsii]